MCGRYRLKRTWKEIHDLYEITNQSNLRPRWNVAPTQDVPVVRLGDGGRRLDELKWGLIPSWAKEKKKFGASCINARSETVAEKPTFRSAFKVRRCLVVADGYYEWQTEGKEKLPWLFTVGDDELFSFAGIWETWKSPEGEQIETCALMTTEPNPLAATVHDRMPVILERSEYQTWLDPGTPVDQLKAMLDAYPQEQMAKRRVSKKINSSRYDGPDLEEAATGEAIS